MGGNEVWEEFQDGWVEEFWANETLAMLEENITILNLLMFDEKLWANQTLLLGG